MPSIYREVVREGRLDYVVGQSLATIGDVLKELIAWKLGQEGSALVYRKSYKQLCDAIDILSRIPKKIDVPDKIKDIIIEHKESVSTDKRRKVSRVRRLSNAQVIIYEIDELMPHYLQPNLYPLDNQFLYDLATTTSALLIAVDLIPWRFEKKPKQMRK